MLCYEVTELVTTSNLLQIVAQNVRFGLHHSYLHFNSIINFSDAEAYTENRINQMVCVSERQKLTELNLVMNENKVKVRAATILGLK